MKSATFFCLSLATLAVFLAWAPQEGHGLINLGLGSLGLGNLGQANQGQGNQGQGNQGQGNQGQGNQGQGNQGQANQGQANQGQGYLPTDSIGKMTSQICDSVTKLATSTVRKTYEAIIQNNKRDYENRTQNYRSEIGRYKLDALENQRGWNDEISRSRDTKVNLQTCEKKLNETLIKLKAAEKKPKTTTTTTTEAPTTTEVETTTT